MATDTKSPDRICYLGYLIRQYCRTNRVLMQDLARAVGKHPSCITKLCQGDRLSLSHTELQKLAAVITDDPQERVNLVVAYLLDQCPPGYRDMVRIEAVELQLPAVPGV